MIKFILGLIFGMVFGAVGMFVAIAWISCNEEEKKKHKVKEGEVK